MRLLAWLGGACAVALVSGCLLDTVPEPLRRTPAGPGATVVFATDRRPLPELPLPNDVATFPDPTSRTGLRLNASLVAPSSLETEARAALAEQEGWGTFMPLTVAFERTADMDPRLPALDLDELRRRTHADEHSFEDDPVYLVDLETGVPIPLSFGAGELPVVLFDQDKYGPNDPHLKSHNLLFEENEEGTGLSQADYRPSLDLDFDGILDHPNVWPRSAATDLAAPPDGLMSVYERETDTLIVRPLLALREKREYAVVLTSRLLGQDRRPVRSPFEGIYHPQQRRAAARIQQIFSDPARASYYGDLAGSGLDGVAFLWSFTTAPQVEDLRLLRDGLYSHGPFARLGAQFPPRANVFRSVGPPYRMADDDPACEARKALPFAVKTDDPQFREGVEKILRQLFTYGDGPIAAVKEGLDATSHVLIGDYASPYLMGDPQNRKKDDRFHLDFRSGQGPVHSDRPQFWASVPKPSPGHAQPYPVVLWAHGVGSNGVEALLFGGDFARNGLATVTVNMPLHGLPDTNLSRIFVGAQLEKLCLSPFVDAVLKNRVLDLNGDGDGDVAHWWFTLHTATVRDNLRQAAVDYMQFARVLRTFDGKTMSGQDYNGDGREDLAGDFDGNGVPDFGGPNVPLYLGGASNGGLMSQILGGVAHEFDASVSVSGGGGLTDVAIRSYGIAGSVFQGLSPMLVAIPASERAPLSAGAATRTNCTSGSSVRIVYSDGPNPTELEIACLEESELSEDQTVVVRDADNHEVRCARTGSAGRFRIPIPASAGDRLSLEIYAGADRVVSYKGCELTEGATPSRIVDAFEQPEITPRRVTDANPGCPDDAERGCTRAFARFYPVGSPLLSPQEGFGLERQTPDLRRIFYLGQSVLDAADPVTFARHHILEPVPNPDGSPGRIRPLLTLATVGDGFVPVSTLQQFARSAGLLPMFPPSAWDKYPEYREHVTPPSLYERYGKTPERLLIDTFVTEGNASYARSAVASAACGVNQTEVAGVCGRPARPSAAACREALYDVDWFAEGQDGYGANHPEQPLRLVRRSEHVGTEIASLERVWAPRTLGAAGATTGFAEDVQLSGVGHVYVAPQGAHTWVPPDVCEKFDDATWGNLLNGRFLASGGRDIYYVTHPATHRCLATRTCDFLSGN